MSEDITNGRGGSRMDGPMIRHEVEQEPVELSQAQEDSYYLPEDYSATHCKHGTFIGYPGGADYMCGYCEAGE